MKVIWFEDQDSCAAGLEMINANMRALAVSIGYSLDEDGNIIGKDEEGADVPQAQVTTTWDIPHEDELTAGWFILSPRSAYPDAFDDIMVNVEDWTEGEYEPPMVQQLGA